MNAVFKDDAVFPIINLHAPEDERLASMAEPYHWNGRVFTQYPFPVAPDKPISLLSLSSNPETDAAWLTNPCDSIGDLAIRAIVFQDAKTGNVYRRYLAHDQFFDHGTEWALTDNKGNLTVEGCSESGVVRFRGNAQVIGVYLEGYRYDENRRQR